MGCYTFGIDLDSVTLVVTFGINLDPVTLVVKLDLDIVKMHIIIKRRSCCDMGQNDTIGKIELIPFSVLSENNTNC